VEKMQKGILVAPKRLNAHKGQEAPQAKNHSKITKSTILTVKKCSVI
jgi:hypothetical protein